jgi:hypothetical protein
VKVTEWNPGKEELAPPKAPVERMWLVGGVAAKPLKGRASR